MKHCNICLTPEIHNCHHRFHSLENPMMKVTRYRDKILEALREWFSLHKNAPTLEELCVELGMKPKQKATLQRWLQTMRGVDIEWDDNVARSIRFLREETPEPEIKISVRETLRYLATGLAEWENKKIEERGNIPDTLRIGMSRMYLTSILQEDNTAPENLPKFFEFSKKPFINWKPSQELKYLSSNVSLVEANSSSNFAQQWLVTGNNIHLEIQETILKDILIFCRCSQLEETYRKFRELIITKPVLSCTEYNRLIRQEYLSPLKDYFPDVYKPLNKLKADEIYYFCPRCGYVQDKNYYGSYHCRSQSCQKLVIESALSTKLKITRNEAETYNIVTPGIHKYGTIPGLWEIDLKEELSKLGLHVTLWPEIDEFDLLVEFSQKLKWAIDVKDWSWLDLEKLKKVKYQGKCQETFIVFPDIREKELDMKKNRKEIETELNGIKLKLISEVIQQAKNILGK